MKKFAALFLTVIMTVSLAACGLDNNSSGNSGRNNSNSIENSNSTNDSSKIDNFRDFSGKTTGIVGDTLNTTWFDFTVNSVSAYGNEYQGYTAGQMNRLLVVNVTIENTFDAVNPMYDSDFIIIWGDDYYTIPVEDAENLSDDILPSEYQMSPGDKVTGDLLFEIPASETDLTFSYEEIDDQGNTYDTYKVSFQVDAFEYESETIYGGLGDVMSTYWFDFSVDEAVLTTEYEGSTPSAGRLYLVLTITMENTFIEAVPMNRDDFDVEWEDPESYETPVMIFIGGEELTEDYYKIPDAGLVDATMVFEVDEGYDMFAVYFDEYFEDGTLGNIWCVSFVPDEM